MRLLQLLCPREVFRSVFDVAGTDLMRQGIRGLVLDLDNTLVPWSGAPSERLVKWVLELKEQGLSACIVSNNLFDRVDRFCQELDIPGIANASKPRRRAFREAMERMGTRPEETAVIGDQLFTDILGGNRLGLHTILVAPQSQREFLGTRLVRVVEGLVLGALRRRGMLAG